MVEDWQRWHIMAAKTSNVSPQRVSTIHELEEEKEVHFPHTSLRNMRVKPLNHYSYIDVAWQLDLSCHQISHN